ncbi:SDR family NAD(P)-dependent oxidoreductase [Pseudoroseicyclus aestuarii]|uniref:Short-subunit dehydrogenase n=1 Tax=Pseudoroseicyclus aestuarii TaxID=1795041 RepID=A0A318T3U6_9RHOB|nr:SDR family NAD(P)-dependent oxidoreductase [Pseudoroseicyclus aestuarii]PYE84924.1 short-subunit dehydrogenase [Pseudoroseicyclus aestuarii]
MRDWTGKRYWIVGASEGLGRALAKRISGAGAHVILSARTRDRLDDLAAELRGPSEIRPVDVADRAAVEEVARGLGEIDGMVFLAGLYWPMAATDWDAAQAEQMADVNFTGALRTVGAVLPGMLRRGSGHIALTGSIAGYRGLPGAIGYGASKAAVMSLAESLHYDLRRTPVEVQLVNPGFVRTRLTDKNDFAMPGIMDAEEAAQLYFEHLNAGGFQRSFPLAMATALRATRLLPEALYHRIFRGR